MDDRTGTEEEQRLEERVRREVEHRGPRASRDRNLVGRRAVTVAHPQRAEAEGGHHVAELRQRRVSQDLLDVVLDDRAKRRIQGGHRADPQDDIERDRRRREERLDPAQHVDARRHHGRRVDQRRHRGRAFHRVRQPDVQRHLSRLAKGTAEEQERDARRDHLAAADGGRDLGQVHRAERGLAPEDAEEEAEVADAIHDERLLGGIGGRGLLVVMVDQEVGAEAHQFPEHENHQQVVREHDAEHREHEDREPAKVPRPRPVVVHVAERKHVHRETDNPDDRQHEGGEVIELEAERQREVSQLQPRHRRREALAAQGEREAGAGHRHGRRHGHQRGQPATPAEEERDHRGRGQRREQDEKGERKGGHGIGRKFSQSRRALSRAGRSVRQPAPSAGAGRAPR